MAVGGWKSRTTVEDMDLSLRTYVNGWKAIYLNDVVCMNEVQPFTSQPITLCNAALSALSALLADLSRGSAFGAAGFKARKLSGK